MEFKEILECISKNVQVIVLKGDREIFAGNRVDIDDDILKSKLAGVTVSKWYASDFVFILKQNTLVAIVSNIINWFIIEALLLKCELIDLWNYECDFWERYFK